MFVDSSQSLRGSDVTMLKGDSGDHLGSACLVRGATWSSITTVSRIYKVDKTMRKYFILLFCMYTMYWLVKINVIFHHKKSQVLSTFPHVSSTHQPCRRRDKSSQSKTCAYPFFLHVGQLWLKITYVVCTGHTQRATYSPKIFTWTPRYTYAGRMWAKLN